MNVELQINDQRHSGCEITNWWAKGTVDVDLQINEQNAQLMWNQKLMNKGKKWM